MATKTKSTKRKLPARYQWLAKMRALLAKPRGWIKVGYTNGVGYCLLGAANIVGSNSAGVAKALRIPIRPHGDAFDAVTQYNDSPRTTKKQVLARIDRAIREHSK